MTHVKYIGGLVDEGKTVLSGPFMESPGGLVGKLANGGVGVIKAADLEEVTRLGTDDPTVQSGMLKSRLRHYGCRFTNEQSTSRLQFA